jgi:hypothetical protein
MSSKFALKAQVSVVALSTALAVVGGASKASAIDTLFYSGDPTAATLLGNRAGAAKMDAAVYQPFQVPTGQTWTVQDIFTTDTLNYAMPVSTVTANWSINQNVAPGSAGTVVKSGSGTANVTNDAANHSKVDVTVPNVTLTSGTYWLSVVPVSPQAGKGDSYIDTTSGVNSNIPASVVAPAFWNVPAGGVNFVPTTTYTLPPYFSAGVNGVNNAGAPVPFEFSPPLGLLILGTWGAYYQFKQSKQKKDL